MTLNPCPQRGGDSNTSSSMGQPSCEPQMPENKKIQLICWAQKNWCFWTVVLGKTLEEIQPVHPKGDRSWVFIGRTDVEAEAPVFWPPDAKSWLIWKDLDVGKDWGQEEKGMTEDEMVGRHHWPNGHGFGWTPGVGDRQGGLACCGSWNCKESDTTEWLNWTELIALLFLKICDSTL